MAILDLFSKRKKAAEAAPGEVYIYDVAPPAVRMQIVHIFEEAVSLYDPFARGRGNFVLEPSFIDELVKMLRREYGVRALTNTYCSDALEELTTFIQECSVDNFLDCAEILCRVALNSDECKRDEAEAVVKEVNYRLRQSEMGYEYVEGCIIKIENAFIHKESVKPSIMLLSSDPIYKGAESEFFSAFSHYKDGKNKEAILDALKAFESTMKAILTKRKWPFSPNDPASKLLQICFASTLR